MYMDCNELQLLNMETAFVMLFVLGKVTFFSLEQLKNMEAE